MAQSIDERIDLIFKKTLKAKPARRGANMVIVGMMAKNAGESVVVLHGGFSLSGSSKIYEPGDVISNAVISEIAGDRLAAMFEHRFFVPQSAWTRSQAYQAMKNCVENILPVPRSVVSQDRQALNAAVQDLAAAHAQVLFLQNQVSTRKSQLAKSEKALLEILDSDPLKVAFQDPD
jgi:hypothetical protein